MRLDNVKGGYDIIINDNKYAHLTNKHIYYPDIWILLIQSEDCIIHLNASSELDAKISCIVELRSFLQNKIQHYETMLDDVTNNTCAQNWPMSIHQP